MYLCIYKHAFYVRACMRTCVIVCVYQGQEVLIIVYQPRQSDWVYRYIKICIVTGTGSIKYCFSSLSEWLSLSIHRCMYIDVCIVTETGSINYCLSCLSEFWGLFFLFFLFCFFLTFIMSQPWPQTTGSTGSCLSRLGRHQRAWCLFKGSEGT